MNLEAKVVKAFGEETHGEEGKISISFFLGRNSKYKDKILNIMIDENVADKLTEELMRVIWEKKVKEGKIYSPLFNS